MQGRFSIFFGDGSKKDCHDFLPNPKVQQPEMVNRLLVLLPGGPMTIETAAHVFVSGALFTYADPSHRDGKLFTLIDFFDSSVTDPDHLVRNVQHLYVMGGGNDRDFPFPA